MKKKKKYYNSFEKSYVLSFLNSVNLSTDEGLPKVKKVSYKKKIVLLLTCLIGLIILIIIVSSLLVVLTVRNKNHSYNYSKNFNHLVEMSTLQNSGKLGHSTSLKGFEKYNVNNVLAVI